MEPAIRSSPPHTFHDQEPRDGIGQAEGVQGAVRFPGDRTVVSDAELKRHPPLRRDNECGCRRHRVRRTPVAARSDEQQWPLLHRHPNPFIDRDLEAARKRRSARVETCHGRMEQLRRAPALSKRAGGQTTSDSIRSALRAALRIASAAAPDHPSWEPVVRSTTARNSATPTSCRHPRRPEEPSSLTPIGECSPAGLAWPCREAQGADMHIAALDPVQVVGSASSRPRPCWSGSGLGSPWIRSASSGSPAW